MTEHDQSKFDLSIVIVSYNTKELTQKCVQSILDMDTDRSIEIIVVDNASPDGSAKHLNAHFPEINVIESGGNHGFSYANNLGFAASNGHYILCLNPDTVLNVEAVEASITYLDCNPLTKMVGVRLVNENGVEEIAAMRFLNPLHFFLLALFPKELVHNLPLLGDTRYSSRSIQSRFECDALVGCYMLIPRSLLDTVGGLDDHFFMYGEEVEWCHRIRRNGFKIAYLGDQSILHYDGASTRTLSSWKLSTMAKGQILAQAKMHGWLAAKFVNCSMILGQVLRLPAWGLIALLRNREPLLNNWAKLVFLCRVFPRPLKALHRTDQQ